MKAIREHGTKFSSIEEIRKILNTGKKAVVVKKGTEILLYGEPSKDEELVEKLKTEAGVIFKNENAEIVVLSKRIIPL